MDLDFDKLIGEEEIEDILLYQQGDNDCLEGKPHVSGKGKDYDRGYAVRYEWQQVMDNITGKERT